MNFTEFKSSSKITDTRERWHHLFREGETVSLENEYRHMTTFWPKGTICEVAHITQWQVVLVFPDKSRMVLSPTDIAKLEVA